jgi:hypothetical protein
MITLTPQNNDYLLTRTTDDHGQRSAIILSPDEILTLANLAENLRQSVLANSHPQSIHAVEVTDILVHPEVFGETVLLTVRFGISGASQSTLAFPLPLASRLVMLVNNLVVTLQSRGKPSKQ